MTWILEFLLKTVSTSNARRLKKITKMLGLANSDCCFGITIPHSKFVDTVAWVLKNKKRLSKIFSLRLRATDKAKRPGYDLLNMILNAWGYTSITKKVRMRPTGLDAQGQKSSIDTSDYMLKSTSLYLSAGHIISRLARENIDNKCLITENLTETVFAPVALEIEEEGSAVPSELPWTPKNVHQILNIC